MAQIYLLSCESLAGLKLQTTMLNLDERILKLNGCKIHLRARDKRYERLDNRIIESLDAYEVTHLTSLKDNIKSF